MMLEFCILAAGLPRLLIQTQPAATHRRPEKTASGDHPLPDRITWRFAF